MNGRPTKKCPICNREICTRDRAGRNELYPHKCILNEKETSTKRDN